MRQYKIENFSISFPDSVLSIRLYHSIMEHEPSEEIFQCADGKYRWVYEKSLYRDPTILLLLFKVLGITVFIIWLFYMVVLMMDSASPEDLWGATKFNLLMFCLIMVLGLAGYLLYAVIMGGKYCVVFTMDEKGVKHAQHSAQVKKATIISQLTVLLGALSKNPTVAGVGMNSARTEMYTKFSQVSVIRVDRKHETIFIGGNQVYAREEDFDFVLDYIKDHCPKAKVR